MFSVAKLPQKPDRYREHVDPMFYATIDPASNVAKIQGMSGGPIIGFKNLGVAQPPVLVEWRSRAAGSRASGFIFTAHLPT